MPQTMDNRALRVKYFSDTDTTLVEFADGPPVETRELDENIYLDLDQTPADKLASFVASTT